MKTCFSTIVIVLSFALFVFLIKDCSRVEKEFSREKWFAEPWSRYEMKSDLKKRLKGKTKKDVIEMLGDSTTTYSSDDRWQFVLGNNGDLNCDCLFMIIFFKNDKVVKVDYECI